MTTTAVNDRDVLLQASQRQSDPRANKYINLDIDTPFFHISTPGTPSPSTINFTATPINIGGGTVQFSAPTGVKLTVNGNTASLAFADMQVDSANITVTITDMGQTYTNTKLVSKVQDGTVGKDGPPGAQYATAYLYPWNTAQPALPTGTSSLAWNVGANTSYVGTDNWYTTPPNNPGGAVSLWVAQKQVTAASGTQTTSVTYTSGATLFALSSNGPQGLQGVPGIKQVRAVAYVWGVGAAPTATGPATYTWATASYNTPPASASWTTGKTNAPALGYTLYEASVPLVDATGATTSQIDWTKATVTAISYMPNNGTGSTGAQGASATIAYVLVDGNSLASTPSTLTTSGTNLPPAGSSTTPGTWGETRTWQSFPPIAAAGQSVFQSNGVYNPAANSGAGATVWGVPYLSSLRVGSLSAITTNTGTLNVSGTISSANGNFTVDSNGNATMKSVTILASDGSTILSSGTRLNINYAPTATLNSNISIGSNGALNGGGGGQVTIGGLGYSGDLNATNGATLGQNVYGQITTANINALIAAG